ncbi:hypothetical protein MED121_12625 [Marinomonas sp. MED121]|uniref:endonuclease/exonuclease/phosphatase family protein n=1 Tax=Marinomonas sp. MED121 TaxID=314277 RepID=UPI000068FFD8|nr:endonuclease/exonuclease/phosphatase family protein [Marinomonas sp. MED121]EAQ66771.1 hypothetical protein MED121_12625 [Marinomonas sp. MED121]
MKVAFWNINTGPASSVHRHNALKDWCAWAKDQGVDLIMLVEVGDFENDKLETLTGYNYINNVANEDINNHNCKRIFALEKDKDTFNGVSMRFPQLQQRRNLLKVTYKQNKAPHNNLNGFSAWVIHANASQIGGKNAVENVLKHTTSGHGEDCIVGGDFNYDIGKEEVQNATHPLSCDSDNLKFTQWDKENENAIKKNDYDRQSELHLRNATNLPTFKGIKEHSIIDYVISGEKRTVTALKSCEPNMWRDILMQFDHSPVVYEIT